MKKFRQNAWHRVGCLHVHWKQKIIKTPSMLMFCEDWHWLHVENRHLWEVSFTTELCVTVNMPEMLSGTYTRVFFQVKTGQTLFCHFFFLQGQVVLTTLRPGPLAFHVCNLDFIQTWTTQHMHQTVGLFLRSFGGNANSGNNASEMQLN